MADFISVFNAVERNKRTERAAILSAMYVLGAAAKPVTVQQINDLLHLHLGNKAPPKAKVSTRLRQYAPEVRIAEEGPPLKWMLSDTGLERLRVLTRLALPVDEEA